MTDADKTRIEIEKESEVLDVGKGLYAKLFRKGYIAGATVWAERLNTEQHLVNVYKIQAKAAQERLKQEKNKTLQEAIHSIAKRKDEIDQNEYGATYRSITYGMAMDVLESLKSKPE